MKWIIQESGGLGHWGYGGDRYKLTISGEKFKKSSGDFIKGAPWYSRGSIGFYQILSYHCYPYNHADGKLTGYSLYNPKEYIEVFIRFTCTDHIAGNIYKAFKSQKYKVTQKIDSTKYPHLNNEEYGRVYIDNSKDLLSKCFSGYNTSAFKSVFSKYTWPQLLKKCTPPDQGYHSAIKYSCELQKKLGLPQNKFQSKWSWKDKGTYICKDSSGKNIELDTVFTFFYSQWDYWHPGEVRNGDVRGLPHTPWKNVRNAALERIRTSFEDKDGNCLPCR